MISVVPPSVGAFLLAVSPARALESTVKFLSGYSDAQILACSGLAILLFGTALSYVEKLRRPAVAPIAIDEKKNRYTVAATAKTTQQLQEKEIRYPISARS